MDTTKEKKTLSQMKKIVKFAISQNAWTPRRERRKRMTSKIRKGFCCTLVGHFAIELSLTRSYRYQITNLENHMIIRYENSFLRCIRFAKKQMKSTH